MAVCVVELGKRREWGDVDCEAMWERIWLEALRVYEGIHDLTDLYVNIVSNRKSNAIKEGLTVKEVHAYAGK